MYQLGRLLVYLCYYIFCMLSSDFERLFTQCVFTFRSYHYIFPFLIKGHIVYSLTNLFNKNQSLYLLYLVLLKYKEKYNFPIRSDLMDIHTCFYFFVIPTSAKNLRKIWSEVQIVIGNIMSSTSHEDVVVALLSDGGSGSCIQQSCGNKEIAVIVHGRTLCCLRSVDDVDTY